MRDFAYYGYKHFLPASDLMTFCPKIPKPVCNFSIHDGIVHWAV
jgi:hypothetical protein